MSTNMVSEGKGGLASYFNSKFSSLFKQWGTFKGGVLTDDDMKPTGYNLDLLLSLSNTKSRLVFGQFGLHHADVGSRTYLNMGLGRRQYFKNWMLGINGFVDQDLTREHSVRGSLGVEIWKDNLKLGSNYYFPLSGWKDASQIEDYQSRPAQGVDLDLHYYLPFYPQLGLKLKDEQYFGSLVDLQGSGSLDSMQADPYRLSSGMDYTPIPLLSFDGNYSHSKGGNDEFTLGAHLTYRFGVPIDKQIDPDMVKVAHSLRGMRFDLVERNPVIVLEYRKKTVLQVALPKEIELTEGESKVIVPEIHAKYHPLQAHWSSSLNGPSNILASLSSEYALEPTISKDIEAGGDENNHYPLTLTVTDSKGNTASATTEIVVKPNPSLNPQIKVLPGKNIHLLKGHKNTYTCAEGADADFHIQILDPRQKLREVRSTSSDHKSGDNGFKVAYSGSLKDQSKFDGANPLHPSFSISPGLMLLGAKPKLLQLTVSATDTQGFSSSRKILVRVNKNSDGGRGLDVDPSSAVTHVGETFDTSTLKVTGASPGAQLKYEFNPGTTGATYDPSTRLISHITERGVINLDISDDKGDYPVTFQLKVGKALPAMKALAQRRPRPENHQISLTDPVSFAQVKDYYGKVTVTGVDNETGQGSFKDGTLTVDQVGTFKVNIQDQGDESHQQSKTSFQLTVYPSISAQDKTLTLADSGRIQLSDPKSVTKISNDYGGVSTDSVENGSGRGIYSGGY
ncbi:inverse autotransporter beta domain-containing protein [Dongshaea marina]|uniref:inverse autotransporter beta domain-containing protein n=1 Tax=Dongshaea marina TaxID=2047966 RepID=UPI00131ED198|nr:inverse autotransporter beta domain-containing protein [Dongshaea marina]